MAELLIERHKVIASIVAALMFSGVIPALITAALLSAFGVE